MKREINDVVYVFTDYGLCRGVVRVVIKYNAGTAYKLIIDLNELPLDYKFEFAESDLFSTPQEAIRSLMVKYKLDNEIHNKFYKPTAE